MGEKAPFMGRRTVAPPFTACPEWSEWGGVGIHFPNCLFLNMWVRPSAPSGEERNVRSAYFQPFNLLMRNLHLPLLFILLFTACQPLQPQPIEAQVYDGEPTISVVAEGLLGPIGLAAFPGGGLLIAEEGTGSRDESAGVTHLAADGTMQRLISGLPSTRDAGDLAGVPLVSVSPDGLTIYVANFGQGHLWTLPVADAKVALDNAASGIVSPTISDAAFAPEELGQAMVKLNNVFLVNPFDMAYDAAGVPVVSDASGNGVAKQNADGSTRFIHRFDRIPNPIQETNPVEAVPTGITRVGAEYFVTLFGGCPYPANGGLLVAIDEARNQRTVVDGLNLPIDVAQGADGTVWVLEFAQFTPDASCFDGSGYQPGTGRLSRLTSDGTLEPVLSHLDFPGAVLPMPDGSLYISEVLTGRVLHVVFEAAMDDGRLTMDGESNNRLSSMDPRPLFEERASEVGLDFQHGAFSTHISMDPVAAMGGGLCWLDYDNDGWLDLYLVNSHALDEVAYWDANGGLPRNGLFRNDGGTFASVSAASGADLAGRGNGCVAADFNNDGWTDIFVTRHGSNQLLWNQGDRSGEGIFVEGAVDAGVDATTELPEWSSAAVVADLNSDGLLDLFVAGYIDLSATIPKPTGHFPQDYYGIPDHLYINQGIDDETGWATFREVTELAGLVRSERGLGALFSDLDQDGDLDLYIANDGHPNRLYANEAVADDPDGLGFQLVDLTKTADVGDSGSGMGVAGGDYDGDGQFDLFVTNWDTELNALYRNVLADEEILTFQYSTFRIGISGLGNGLTGWGTHMADFDQDTDADLMTVNGHVPISDPAVDAELVRFYRNRTRNLGGVEDRPGQFLDWTEQVGLKAVGPLMARGSAAADYDNDGDLDVAINTIGGDVVLLHNLVNEEQSGGNWLTVSVEGNQPGTIVTVDLADGRALLRELRSGSSYLASEDVRLHFGLGSASSVTKLTVTWPDGERVTLGETRANQLVLIQRPE